MLSVIYICACCGCHCTRQCEPANAYMCAGVYVCQLAKLSLFTSPPAPLLMNGVKKRSCQRGWILKSLIIRLSAHSKWSGRGSGDGLCLEHIQRRNAYLLKRETNPAACVWLLINLGSAKWSPIADLGSHAGPYPRRSVCGSSANIAFRPRANNNFQRRSSPLRRTRRSCSLQYCTRRRVKYHLWPLIAKGLKLGIRSYMYRSKP